MRQLTTALVFLWPFLVGIVAVVTRWSAKSVFHPLSRLALQAGEISGTNLKERLAAQDDAEFGELAAHLNAMLDRLESAARREEQFAIDVAHELRTPLAVMRIQIETALLRERAVVEYQGALITLLAEVVRLTEITESLLLSTAGASAPVPEIDFRSLVELRVEYWRPKFVEAGLKLSTETESARLSVLPAEARVVVDNLLANALKFSSPSGETHVSIVAFREGVELAVSNDGSPLPAELGERVFERFVRGDTGRNSSTAGQGIGLAICKRIVESRGGTIFLRETVNGPCFVCSWPLNPDTSPLTKEPGLG